MENNHLSNRVGAAVLKDRIDAEYYKKTLLENEKKLDRFQQKPLASLVNKTAPNNIADLTSNGSFAFLRGIQFNETEGIPFLRTQNLMEGFIDDNNMIYVNRTCSSMVTKSICRNGDLVVCRKGKVGAASTIPDRLNGSTISENVTRFVLQDNVDGDFIAAFLNSKQGHLRFLREATGVVQKWINNEKLRKINIIDVSNKAQTYIGNKVRQAEKLRKVADKKLQLAQTIFDDVINWGSKLEEKSLYYRASKNELDQRLDLNFNSPRRFRLTEHLKENKIKLEELEGLVQISAMIGWKGLTTEHYTNEGPWLLRGVEFNNGIIDYEKMVSIPIDKYDEQPQIHLQNGDIAMTKDGTIGKAIVIPNIDHPMAAGSTVARLRPLNSANVSPYFLEFAINHPLTQIQISSFSTGMAQPHITQKWIKKLLIPRCEQEEKIALHVENHHTALELSSKLLSNAMLLVELLIENKVSESDLKSIQEACERGNYEPERELLKRLSREGIDEVGEPPLFPDLDTLYETLALVDNQ